MALHPLSVARYVAFPHPTPSHPRPDGLRPLDKDLRRRSRLGRPPELITVGLAVMLTILTVTPSSAGAVSTGNGGWHWQNPRPVGGSYEGGHFFDSQNGWLVSGGCILKTADGGRTVRVLSRHNVLFRDITFVDRRHGWAVGWPVDPVNGRAIIYRTTDGGSTWTRIPIGFRGHLNAVSFVDREVGWAVGARPGGVRSLVLKTADGGRHWTLQTASNSWEWQDVQALGRRRVWIVGDDSAMARTADGGRHWTAVDPGIGENFVAVHFGSRLVGWAASWGSVIRTVDGGATWTTQYSIGGGSDLITDISFADAQHGWFVDDGGHIHATANGGSTWPAQASPAGRALYWVGALSASVAFAGGFAGDLRRTTDGGAHWMSSNSFAAGYDDTLSDVDFVGADRGWAVGGTVLATVNGGSSWSAQDPGTSRWLHAVDFVDALNGWAVGDDGVIRHTVNGGATWVPQTSWTARDLRGLTFIDSQNGWAVGGEWDWTHHTGAAVIRHTANGGASWHPQVVPTAGDPTVLLDVAFADTLHGWVVGWTIADEGWGDGLILGTVDGGITWSVQLIYDAPESHSTGEAALYGVACTSASRAVAVGYEDNADGAHPLVFRTTDGGISWKKYAHPSSWLRTMAGFRDVTLRGAKGWAVGGNGIIARTDDRGVTWKLQRSGVSGSLEGVSFSDGRRGWVVGDGAAILKTRTGGLRP